MNTDAIYIHRLIRLYFSPSPVGFTQGHPIFFDRAGIEEILVMLEPVKVFDDIILVEVIVQQSSIP